MQILPAPLQEINDEIIVRKGIRLYMLRTELNHPEISGNKFYKLRYNLEEARKQNKDTILTFGGAYSNHIAATAAAGKEAGFRTMGVIRGEQADNSTLLLAKKNGMQLHFVSRELYGDKKALALFAAGLGDAYIIPEGGANEAGVRGCMEISREISVPFDVICCPCGTGTTLTGIILSLQAGKKALGFQVLKGEGYMKEEVRTWLEKMDSRADNWDIREEFHFGGYARHNPELIRFIQEFEAKQGIRLEHVYTGKMMFGLYSLIEKGYFPKNLNLVAIHTGGLQGRQEDLFNNSMLEKPTFSG